MTSWFYLNTYQELTLAYNLHYCNSRHNSTSLHLPHRHEYHEYRTHSSLRLIFPTGFCSLWAHCITNSTGESVIVRSYICPPSTYVAVTIRIGKGLHWDTYLMLTLYWVFLPVRRSLRVSTSELVGQCHSSNESHLSNAISFGIAVSLLTTWL